MPFCSECGKNYQDSANFCPYWGTPNSLSSGSNQTNIVENGSDTTSPSAFQTVKRNSSSYGAYRLEDLQKGFIIDDRYEVKKKLGQGGFGTVYLVNDRTLNTQKEAQTLMQLTHDSIVRIYDLHLTGSIKYLDMEYIEGKPLNELKLEYEDKKVPEDLVIELAKKIINELSYAHQNKIILRL